MLETDQKMMECAENIVAYIANHEANSAQLAFTPNLISCPAMKNINFIVEPAHMTMKIRAIKLLHLMMLKGI